MLLNIPKQDADEAMEDTQQTSVESYTGVSIKVSFNSKVDEGLRIQQLSGGQKSLVALALGRQGCSELRFAILMTEQCSRSRNAILPHSIFSTRFVAHTNL
jgi:hypothetical protein